MPELSATGPDGPAYPSLMNLEISRDKVRQLRFLTAFACIATVGIWLNLLYYTWFPAPLRWNYPDNTFQAVQVSRFSDFYDMANLNQERDPYNVRHLKPAYPGQPQWTAYPPLANIGYHLFSLFRIDYVAVGTDGPRKAQDWAIWIFLGIPFFAFPILALCWLRPVMPALGGLLVVIAFNLSYPMLFAIDRGNLELYTLVFLTVFAWAASASSPAARWVAVAALGVAAALKIYPLIFTFIYLKQRRWLEALGAVAVCGALTLLAYLCLYGGLTQNLSAHWAFMHRASGDAIVDIRWATRYSSSLYSLIFLSLKALFHRDAAAAWFQHKYSVVLPLFMVGSMAVVALRRLSFGRLLGAVCCIAILSTPESPDYKLLLLFPAVLAIIVEGGGRRVFNLLFVAIMGLLLVPKNWVMIFNEVSYGSIYNPLLVLCLLVLLVAAPARDEAALP